MRGIEIDPFIPTRRSPNAKFYKTAESQRRRDDANIS
jgi:hypothetical protein